MKIKHTPGPWKAEKQYFGSATYAISHEAVILTKVRCGNNAKLIAASPLMYRALQAIVATLDGGQPKDTAGALMIALGAIEACETGIGHAAFFGGLSESIITKRKCYSPHITGLCIEPHP